MYNQKKAEKLHGEKVKGMSSVEKTLKDADDTVSERKLLKAFYDYCCDDYEPKEF